MIKVTSILILERISYGILTLCQNSIGILVTSGLKRSITFRTLLCRVSELNYMTRGYYASL